jgi:type VI secretion system protein ImpD
MNFRDSWLIAFNALDRDSDTFLKKGIEHLLALFNESTDSYTTDRFTSKVIRLIAMLDDILSRQLSLILQHAEFQQLESSWRSLQNLVNVPYQKSLIKIKCLDVSWEDISSDLNLASTIKRSQLFNKIANKEFNTLGGEPFGMMLIDHAVNTDIQDLDAFDELYTLELIGSLGKQALCPILMSTESSFFGEQGARWLTDIQRVRKVMEGPDFLGWKRLREQDSSRFLGLALPRIKLRPAYRHYKAGFVFNEVVNCDVALWGQAQYGFAATLIREYSRISWFGFLKSRWNDRLQGSVLNLPEREGEKRHDWTSPQTDIRLFGQIAQFYSKQGFIPLSHSPLTGKYYFLDNCSIWKPNADDNQPDAHVLALIQTTLISCRIAHYLKVQIREMLGSFINARECEEFLSNWLNKYVSNVSSSNEETLAKYPLRSGKVTVQEDPHNKGNYFCEVSLQPQYQFDVFSGHVVLTTELGGQ